MISHFVWTCRAFQLLLFIACWGVVPAFNGFDPLKFNSTLALIYLNPLQPRGALNSQLPFFHVGDVAEFLMIAFKLVTM